MPRLNGVEVPWDVYNYVQNTGDMSQVAQYAPAPTQNGAQILNAGTASTGIGPGGQVGTGITGYSGGGGGMSGGGQGDMESLLAQQAASASADRAAQMAYDNAMLKFKSDDMAYAEAQRVWQRTFDEEGRRIQGDQWAKGFQLSEGGLTGMYGGQPTLAKIAQDRAAEQWSKNFGLSEAGVTGTYQGAPTEARIGREQGTAQSLLSMAAGLRGPSNYLTYLRTLSNTPRGMADLVGGLAGQYGFGQMQTSAPGSTYERQGLDTLARDFANPATGSGAYNLSGTALPGGSQWNPQNVNAIMNNPTQRGLLQNLYEESGRDWATELASYTSSLPQQSGPQRAALTLR